MVILGVTVVEGQVRGVTFTLQRDPGWRVSESGEESGP